MNELIEGSIRLERDAVSWEVKRNGDGLASLWIGLVLGIVLLAAMLIAMDWLPQQVIVAAALAICLAPLYNLARATLQGQRESLVVNKRNLIFCQSYPYFLIPEDCVQPSFRSLFFTRQRLQLNASPHDLHISAIDDIAYLQVVMENGERIKIVQGPRKCLDEIVGYVHLRANTYAEENSR